MIEIVQIELGRDVEIVCIDADDVRAVAPCKDGAFEVERGGHDLASAVVDVFADEVDAARGAHFEHGGCAEKLFKVFVFLHRHTS